MPIFKKDDRGRATEELDHDLDAIFEAWGAFKAGRLRASEYTFTTSAAALDDTTLGFNAQFFLPSLNHSLESRSRPASTATASRLNA